MGVNFDYKYFQFIQVTCVIVVSLVSRIKNCTNLEQMQGQFDGLVIA